MAGTAPDKPTMYCRQCQYVLDGLIEHRCPECGTGFDPANPDTFWPTPRDAKARLLRWESIASAICLLLFWFGLPGGRNRFRNPTAVFVVFIVLVAFGVGLALSGTRRGSRVSRIFSAILLILGLVQLFHMIDYVQFLVN